jgi:hypothetical protein
MVNRSAWLAAACAVVMVSGCSSELNNVKHDKSLPECGAFTDEVATLGMQSPGPGPQLIKSPSPEGFDCAYAPPDGTRPTAVGYASILALRPNRDPYQGQPVQKWGIGFATSVHCDGTTGPDPDVPHGTVCYQQRTDHTGSATVGTFARGTGIQVNLQWSNPDGTADQLRTDTVSKANALTQAVIAAL